MPISEFIKEVREGVNRLLDLIPLLEKEGFSVSLYVEDGEFPTLFFEKGEIKGRILYYFDPNREGFWLDSLRKKDKEIVNELSYSDPPLGTEWFFASKGGILRKLKEAVK